MDERKEDEVHRLSKEGFRVIGEIYADLKVTDGNIKDIKIAISGDDQLGTKGMRQQMEEFSEKMNRFETWMNGHDLHRISEKVDKHDRAIRDAKIGTLAIVVFVQGAWQVISTWIMGHGK